MFASLHRGAGILAVLTIPLLFTSTAEAQFGLFGRRPTPLFGPGRCDTCGPTAAIVPPQYAAAQVAYGNPCAQQSVALANPCPCMQQVAETVYREVPVTQYKAVKKTVQRPVVKTRYEERKVTAYKQVMEPRTVQVPTVSYQTVQQCRPVTINRSHWQTVYQPVQKGSSCDYDRRPGMFGWMNRTGYDMRMAFTPNAIRRRQFVPNVQTVNMPYNRTVAVNGTRQVTYNVAKMVPYETTQRVAVQYTDHEDVQVTAYEPYTVTKTVAVGTRTRMAYVNPQGGSTTATALQPTPDRTASSPTPAKSANSGNIQQNSYQVPVQQRAVPQHPAHLPHQTAPQPPAAPAEPNFFLDSHGSTKRPTPTAVTGWRAARSRNVNVAKQPNSTGPTLPAVAAN